MKNLAGVHLGLTSILAASSALTAQDLLVEDAEVLLKIPAPLFHQERGGWSGPRYVASVEVSGNSVSVGGRTDWRVAGFPILVVRTVSKIKHDDETNTTIVDLKVPRLPSVRLTITGDVKLALAAVAASKSEVENVRQEAYKSLATVFFVGPLADLPDTTKHDLLSFAELTAKGTQIGNVTFKDKLYLVIDLGEDDSVYNELKLNQAQRVARVLDDRLLVVLKAFAQPVREATKIQGLKLEYNIPHKDFLREFLPPEHDKLELYANVDDIRRFADADITSQQLVDNSIIIVNSNRVQVPLSQ